MRTHPAARNALVVSADETWALTLGLPISAALFVHFAACRHRLGDALGLVSVEDEGGSTLRDAESARARVLVLSTARPAKAALTLQAGCLASVSGGAALLPGVTASRLANAGHGNTVILAGGSPCMRCS